MRSPQATQPAKEKRGSVEGTLRPIVSPLQRPKFVSQVKFLATPRGQKKLLELAAQSATFVRAANTAARNSPGDAAPVATRHANAASSLTIRNRRYRAAFKVCAQFRAKLRAIPGICEFCTAQREYRKLRSALTACLQTTYDDASQKAAAQNLKILGLGAISPARRQKRSRKTTLPNSTSRRKATGQKARGPIECIREMARYLIKATTAD